MIPAAIAAGLVLLVMTLVLVLSKREADAAIFTKNEFDDANNRLGANPALDADPKQAWQDFQRWQIENRIAPQIDCDEV